MRLDLNEWRRPGVLRGARGAEIYLGKECPKCGGTTRYKSSGDCATCMKRRKSHGIKTDEKAVGTRRALEEKLEAMRND